MPQEKGKKQEEIILLNNGNIWIDYKAWQKELDWWNKHKWKPIPEISEILNEIELWQQEQNQKK